MLSTSTLLGRRPKTVVGARQECEGRGGVARER